MNTKTFGIIAIIGIAAVGGWYYFKKKKSTAAALNSSDTAKTTTAQSSIVADSAKAVEDKAFNDLSATIEADPVFKSKPFPADFYEAVKKDYANIQAGHPRTADYNYGKPGAFMSIADAWKDAMGYSNATHDQLWKIYADYRNASAKSSIGFDGRRSQKVSLQKK